jgi:hypothetical protein
VKVCYRPADPQSSPFGGVQKPGHL